MKRIAIFQAVSEIGDQRPMTLWECERCGALSAAFLGDPEPGTCVPCERWSRRWES